MNYGNIKVDPSRWHICDHAWQNCDMASNCYSYALGRPEFYWAVPGHGYAKTQTLHFFASYDALFEGISKDQYQERLIHGAIKDGLVPITKPKRAKGYYSVALFFSGRNDLGFHWYRQDGDGTWSHKNGWRPTSNRDAQGRIIVDPRQDTESDYPILGGFFLVPQYEVSLRPDFPLIPRGSIYWG